MRGAERTFAAMADLYPGAPIFTLLYDEEGTQGRFAGREITTSPLQRLGVGQCSFRRLLPVFPWAPGACGRRSCDRHAHQQQRLRATAFEHPPGAIHVCYCHAPFRYAWYEQPGRCARRRRRYGRCCGCNCAGCAPGPGREPAGGRLHRQLRAHPGADQALLVASRSSSTRRWRPTASQPGTPATRFLFVAEVVRHKRAHLALEAARRAGAPIQDRRPRPRARRAPGALRRRPSSSAASPMRSWSSFTRRHGR